MAVVEVNMNKQVQMLEFLGFFSNFYHWLLFNIQFSPPLLKVDITNTIFLQGLGFSFFNLRNILKRVEPSQISNWLLFKLGRNSGFWIFGRQVIYFSLLALDLVVVFLCF